MHMSRSASQAVQRRKGWECCATTAAGRLFSITTREHDELVKALGGHRTLFDTKRSVSSEPAEIYNRQHTQYHGILTVSASKGGGSCDLRHELKRLEGSPASVASDDPPNTISSLKTNQAHTLSRTAHSASGTVAAQCPSFGNGRSNAKMPWSTKWRRGRRWVLVVWLFHLSFFSTCVVAQTHQRTSFGSSVLHHYIFFYFLLLFFQVIWLKSGLATLGFWEVPGRCGLRCAMKITGFATKGAVVWTNGCSRVIDERISWRRGWEK